METVAIVYRILGPLEIERGGAAIVVTAAKPRAVLLTLLLRAGAVTSTDVLIDSLWPSRPPASATKLVQVYVSQLRRVLGAESIETIGPGYRIRVSADALDTDVFERAHAEGRADLAAGRFEVARDALQRALDLWRGPALAEVAEAPFASQAAMRLEEMRLACTEDRLDADLAVGRHEAVLSELAELCREYPLRERLRGRFALALYRSGRQAEALAALREGRRILLEELGLEPDHGLQELEHAILTQDPGLDVHPVAASAAIPALPVPPNSLIGRRDELEALTDLIESGGVRIVTISGAGGSGKTRVALELARRLGPSHADGAAFVELAPLRDPNLVLSAIAKCIGVAEIAEETLAGSLAGWLKNRKLLLVLDNFEHVIDAAPAVAAMSQASSGLRVLVTSRRVLHISGEQVFPLQPMPPDDAVRLFATRASARDPALRFDGDMNGVLRAICGRLDHLPLAVELAAARTVALEPAALLARLSVSIGALGFGPRDAPARQQTLVDTVRWSTDLLDDHERVTFARLSVFVGGCTLDAAEHVAGADLDSIAGLLDASLLVRSITPSGPRLTMLDTIRAYAAELLDQLGPRANAESAHVAYFANLAESTPMRGADAPRGLAVVDADLDNLRVAYDRAAGNGQDAIALRIASPLYRYWYPRGLIREGRDRIKGPLDRGAGEPTARAEALKGLAGLEYLLGEDEAAVASATQGVETGLGCGALDAVLACHTVLGLVSHRRGDLDDARDHFERSRALAEQLGLGLDTVIANTNLGEVALAAGDLDEARRRWELTIELNRELGGNDSYALLGLGDVAILQDRLDAAEQLFGRAQALAEEGGWPHNVAMAVLGLANVAAHRGDAEEAGRMLGRSAALVATTTGEWQGTDAQTFRSVESTVLAAVGPARLAELLRSGRSEVSLPASG